MAINDRDINIHLRLFDNFSSAAARIQAQTANLGQNLERAGRAVSQFGGRLAFVGGATTGAFLIAMKNIEGASPAVTRTFRELENVTRNFQLSIAESAQPALQRLVDMFARVVDAWNELDPALRDSVVQFTFTAGAALLAAGALLKFGGAIATIIGRIVSIVGSLTLKRTALGLVVAGIAAMLTHWDRVKQYVLPIVNALQWELSREAIIVLELGRALIWVTEQALTPFIKAAASLIPILEATKVISKDTADKWRNSLSGISEQFGDAREKMKQQIDALKKDMEAAASNTGGSWAKAVDQVGQSVQNVTNNITTVMDSMQKSMGKSLARSKQEVVNWTSYAEQVVNRLASAMESSLGNFFMNTLKGQIGSAKQFFVDFGNSALQILTQVMAKLILYQTVGRALSGPLGFNPFGKFHSGGYIKRAHNGTLAQDEIPLVAQEGEGVLSRQGMGRLGRGNLNRLNRGEDIEGGGGGSAPVVIIQAWDAQDIQRQSKTIQKIIGDAMKQNSPLRGVMKQYG